MQGWLDPPLAPVGHEQARRLAERLAGVQLSAVYSSDLSRAAETARTLTDGRAAPLTLLSDLKETGHGEWDGLTMREIRERYPREYGSFMERQERFAAPGGESLDDVTARVSSVASELRRLHGPRENLLIVSHSGTLRALLLGLLNLPNSAYWRYRVTPCALSMVDVYEHNAVLDLWNDASHLTAHVAS